MKKRYAAVIFGLCLGLPLMAGASPTGQTAPFDKDYDPAVLRTCLRQTAPDKWAGCVGKGADDCMGKNGNGGANAGMSLCWDNEARDWDRYLTRAYDFLAKDAKEGDALLVEVGSAAAPALPALDAARQAGIVARKTYCDYRMATYQGGSGAGPAGNACWLDMTSTETIRLVRDNFFGDEMSEALFHD